MEEFNVENSLVQFVDIHNEQGVKLYIKREDLIHPFVSGNKYRKLKYNLIEARDSGFKTLLTFGGAHSNHIAATAAAGKMLGFNTIGVIRGEELQNEELFGPTLQFAAEQGMLFKFVSRSYYRNKTTRNFVESLKNEFGNVFVIPEGGTNRQAVKGCEEILENTESSFDFICCPVGTGGTIAGLINCSQPSQQVLGFPALKGSFLHKDISRFVRQTNWKLINDYHFGGYAKINEELVSFINKFNHWYRVPLDPIYTGKMMYGILDMINYEFFPKGSKILAIHTGGLQGVPGMNEKLKNKNLPIIKV